MFDFIGRAFLTTFALLCYNMSLLSMKRTLRVERARRGNRNERSVTPPKVTSIHAPL